MPDAATWQMPDYTRTITVVLREPEKTVVIPRSLAIKTSGLFRTAFADVWKEGMEDTISLPDVYVKEFCAYTHWLYTGKFPMLQEPAGVCELRLDRKDAWIQSVFARHVELYALAEYLGDLECQNQIMNKTIVLSFAKYSAKRRYPGESCIHYIWDKLPESSPMKRLILEFWAKLAPTELLEESIERCPTDFCVKLMNKMTIFREKEDIQLPTVNSSCKYHQHDKELAPVSKSAGC